MEEGEGGRSGGPLLLRGHHGPVSQPVQCRGRQRPPEGHGGKGVAARQEVKGLKNTSQEVKGLKDIN